MTDHPGDLSWTVLRDIETKLAHLFGVRWTEKGSMTTYAVRVFREEELWVADIENVGAPTCCVSPISMSRSGTTCPA